jgi:hypothetical protein
VTFGHAALTVSDEAAAGLISSAILENALSYMTRVTLSREIF